MHYRWGVLALLGAILFATMWQKREAAQSTEQLGPIVEAGTHTPARSDPAAPRTSQPASNSPRRSQPVVPVAWRDLDEDELISALGDLGADDAQLSLKLAREARARFPASPRDAEQRYFEVRALVNLGRLDEAVSLARELAAAHPHDSLANEVARHLLTHPLTHPTEIGRH